MTLYIGFTGTRKGMTEKQKDRVQVLLSNALTSYGSVHVNHGDCVGADSDMHAICLHLGIPMTHFPCSVDSQRAFLAGAVKVHSPRAPLDRNKDIVNASNVLVATPGEDEEVLRSGTWSTIRYAQKEGKPVILVHPDGFVV